MGGIQGIERIREHSTRLDATVAVYFLRPVIEIALQAGVPRTEITRIHGLDERSLADDLNRASRAAGTRLWDLLAWADPGSQTAQRLADAMPVGTLPAWDYQFVHHSTLAAALHDAALYLPVFADPSEDIKIIDEGGRVTIDYRTAAVTDTSSRAIHEYMVTFLLSRARIATGREISPLRVTLSHTPPRHYREQLERFATRRIDFEAPANTLTFSAADARSPLPGADPALLRVFRQHAELMMAASRPVPQWRDEVRAVVAAAMRPGPPSLGDVASRLAMSPRTLQRRLADQGTTWRAELDAVRREQAERLSRGAGFTMDAIAARLGYADARGLRKAAQRWHGHSPAGPRRRPGEDGDGGTAD